MVVHKKLVNHVGLKTWREKSGQFRFSKQRISAAVQKVEMLSMQVLSQCWMERRIIMNVGNYKFYNYMVCGNMNLMIQFSVSKFKTRSNSIQLEKPNIKIQKKKKNLFNFTNLYVICFQLHQRFFKASFVFFQVFSIDKLSFGSSILLYLFMSS